jgi:hypothetical protein
MLYKTIQTIHFEMETFTEKPKSQKIVMGTGIRHDWYTCKRFFS